jgi:hypothetical protein
VATRERAHGGGERGRQGDRHGGAAEALARGARAIGRQLEQRGSAAQVARPEGDLRLQALALQCLALPRGIVGVLQRERRQRVGPPGAEGVVQRRDLAHEHAERPAVRDDVMLRDEQHVRVRGQAQQRGAQQGPRERSNGASCCSVASRATASSRASASSPERSCSASSPAALSASKGTMRCTRRAGVVGELRAQRLVSFDDARERRAQRRDVEIALQAQRHGDVICAARRRIEAVEEPQPLLRPRQGSGPARSTRAMAASSRAEVSARAVRLSRR